MTVARHGANRSSRIALLQYADGVKTYILAPEGLKAGETVIVSPPAELKSGSNVVGKE